MQSFLNQIVRHTARSPVFWPMYQTFGALASQLGRVHGYAQFVRKEGGVGIRESAILQDLFPELVVANGPFRGLRYPRAQSFRTLLPKLLGTYEAELHPVIAEVLQRDYSTVVDIGCAEGYYAIGLGRALTKARVYAFDTDTRARESCGAMAALNGIAERVVLGGTCDPQALRALDLGRKALIFVDCEGYERALFTPELAAFLAPHDLIIEAHDFIDINISADLKRIFDATHQIRCIKSIDDIEKAHTYDLPELKPYRLAERHLILAERRPTIMEWLYLTSKPGA
jgi:precorrin-6B methylase 2